MNLYHAATHITSNHEQHHEADTRLHGRWLLLARIVWFTLVALIPRYLHGQPARLCYRTANSVSARCLFLRQLSPDSVVTLQHFGLSVGSYTAFMVALTIVCVKYPET